MRCWLVERWVGEDNGNEGVKHFGAVVSRGRAGHS
jgi:hypothetical protein